MFIKVYKSHIPIHIFIVIRLNVFTYKDVFLTQRTGNALALPTKLTGNTASLFDRKKVL